MIGPLNSQLNAIKWGEFRLGDLFEIYTGSLLSQEDLAKGDIVRISVKSDNNGVYGHFDTLKNKKARHFENFISVNFFGNCFYHPYLASVEMKVHVLKLKNRLLTRRVGLFLANQLNKCFYGQFTYGTQLSSSKLKHNNFKIQLPLKPTANAQTLEDIDFHFMEKFIAELEQCRLAELEAYLKATGLENTTLSSYEENALNVFNGNNSGGNTPCGLTWQSFKIVDIFEVKNTRNILARDVVKDSGTTPYLCASKENNAVNSYINYNADFLDKGNCIFIGGKTFVVTYQQKDFYSNDSHNLALYLKDTHSKTKLNQLFIITCIYKALNNKYSWGDSISNTKIQNDSILLPTNPHGKIDFDFMHTLINALMKQTIQGVAEYCGAKIQATKEVISQETPIQKDSLF
ncbi:restriction endonuclease subunit S [Helicobacter pylori]|uniref:restriction endonuclease subunit S n=1 Tax=Helicobacter pylori TaxID=210 RepID=UPI0013F3FA54|nr:restriction endonuclease subunit S [Helicobacter pylori]